MWTKNCGNQKRTTEEGIPSTSINRLSFLTDSSTSVVLRVFEEDLYWFRIFVKECAVVAAAELDVGGIVAY